MSNVLNIVEGSIISVSITDDLIDINYLTIPKISDLPFKIKIDGNVLENPGLLALEFVYPNMVVWINGTLTNLFLMDIPKYNHQLQFSPYGSIDGKEYVINITHGNDQKIITREVETGILTNWHLEFDNVVINYDLLIDYDAINNNENPPSWVNRFNFSKLIGISQFIIISIPLYFYSKRHYHSSESLKSR